MSLGVYLVDACPTCGHGDRVEITNGITYNLMPMFLVAGWDNREYDGWTGRKMLPVARQVLERLVSEPDRFKKLNPSNGWGTYEDAIWFFKKMVQECEANPGHHLEFDR